MKKYSYLLILIAFLVGCNESTNSEVTQSSSLNNELSQIVVNSNDNVSSSDNQISSTNVNTTSSIDNNTSLVEVGYWEKKVTFLNGGFTNSTLNQKVSQEQFINWFNGDDDKILDSINYEGYAQMNYIGNEGDANRFSTLILGSQSSEGKITFNFNVTVTTIRVTVQAYSKYIAYNDSYSTDTNATFLINDKEYDLSVEDGHTGDTETIKIECGFGEGVKSLSIANKEARQRVFVHEIEIGHW